MVLESIVSNLVSETGGTQDLIVSSLHSPGARTDTESWVYILNFSKELNDDWKWKERFPRQPEVEEYLNHIVDRFDMRKDIEFKTRVKSCHYDEAKNIWTITTDQGKTMTCRYFVSASGVLSVGRDLPFKGTEKFKGESYKTFAWPKHEIEYAGKRVAVIGTGATAVQLIPIVAHNAKSLTVFQRTANYVLPARNFPMTNDQMNEIKSKYPEIWQGARSQSFGMSMIDTKQTTEGLTEKQVYRILDRGWETGGFRFIFETFADLIVNQKANDMASEFVRDKIHTVVHDEKTAELLCPDHSLFAKRPPLGHYYFETFNKPHVTLVDVKSNRIEEITEKGVRLENGEESEFDMIIYAIGFDASTGALATMDVRGRNDQVLGDVWNKQLETFLGIMVEGFPNMLMLSGPQSPFANLPIVLDNTADWIGKILGYMQKNNYTMAEPTREAMEKWCKLLTDVYNSTILPKAALQAGSWYIGANIPGKPISPLFWFGGVVPYFEICNTEVDNNFPSLTMS